MSEYRYRTYRSRGEPIETCATHGCKFEDGKCIRCWRTEERNRPDFWLRFAWVLYFAFPVACLVIIWLKS